MLSIRALLIASLTCVASVAAAQSTAVEPKAGVILGQPELSSPHAAGVSSLKEDDGCLLQELCFGPLVTLGAVDPLGVGAHLRYGRYVGFGVDYQFLPTHVDLGLASSTWSLFTIEARVYPFGNAFFVSGGFGYERFGAQVHQMTPTGEVGLSGALTMPALKLGIGFMGHDGFVLGADLGFNVLLGHTNVAFGKPTGPGASYPASTLALQQEVNDVASQAVSAIPVVPQVNLIRMGYLF